MKVIDDVFQLAGDKEKKCVAIGAFDGIHQGHKNVIESAIKRAKEIGGISVVFTFENNPKRITRKTPPKLINSKEEKIHLLENLGVDCIIFQNFDKKFSSLSPLEFLSYLKDFGTEEIFVGFNFRFGAGGAATVDDMISMGEAYGIKVNKINPVKSDREEIVSSTLIRRIIEDGDMGRVNDLLGYNLFMIGEVAHGKKLGRQMGFPTANLKLIDKIYPPYGIYGAKVKIEGYSKIYDGVVNIGRNPTLKDGELSVETHILDFSDYIYGKKVRVELIKRLRSEKKFKSMDELKIAIANDVMTWKEYINRKKV